MKLASVPVIPTFNFDSTASSPYTTAPSSPKRSTDDHHHQHSYFSYYTSAPASPTRIAAILSSSSDIINDWEDNSSAPTDFCFDFSGQLEKGGEPPLLTAADKLFEKGKIRPLYEILSPSQSPKSRSKGTRPVQNSERGRDAVVTNTSRKVSRSLSPMKSSLFSTTTIASECLKPSNGSRKWRLRDFFLFRSASEGRATGNKGKDPMRKFTATPSSSSSFHSSGSVLAPGGNGRSGRDSRNSSFRSVDSGGSSTRRSKVSAHEMHYMSNRTVSEEMKKKTALPFNMQGLFGCLRFNPAVNSVVKGFKNGR